MDSPIGAHTPPDARPTPMLELGGLTLTGRSAVITLVVIVMVIVALLAYLRPAPNWPLLVSGALWLLFIGYWSAAARNAAMAKSSESPESRRLHLRLMNAALLLLFIPVPGLRGRYLPFAPLVVVVGLAIQVASGLLAVWARRHLGRNWSGAITIAVDHQLVRSGRIEPCAIPSTRRCSACSSERPSYPGSGTRYSAWPSSRAPTGGRSDWKRRISAWCSVPHTMAIAAKRGR
jgi:hypothetical protein